MTNKEFAEKDQLFKQACEKVGLPNYKTIIKEHGGNPELFLDQPP